nr:hypothetical protein [uncultured Actinoplanes sp.]
MTSSDASRRARIRLRPETTPYPDCLESTLIDAAAGDGDRLHTVPVLGRHGELPEELRGPALRAAAWAAAVPLNALDEIDADAVAEWLVSRYPRASYPAVLFGSPHGAAVHLAAALGAAWLPTGFVVRVPWPGGSAGNWHGAADWGARLAERILATNSALTIRQVHDPLLDGPLCGATVTFHLRWRELPGPYLTFLRTRLAADGVSLVLRDLRSWPVEQLGPDHTMQVGSPVTGLSPDEYDPDRPAFRRLFGELGVERWSPLRPNAVARCAERGVEPGLEIRLGELAAETGQRAVRVLYDAPATLSDCVADLYREHLRSTLGLGDACLIETGRLLDPRGVLERALVPYWCESAAQRTVAGVEWWLAGSNPFDRLTVLPEPPGTAGEAHARLTQWRSLAGFARHTGRVDRVAAGRYPRLPLPRGHVARVIEDHARPRQPIPPMTVRQAVAGLRHHGARRGLFVG